MRDTKLQAMVECWAQGPLYAELIDAELYGTKIREMTAPELMFCLASTIIEKDMWKGIATVQQNDQNMDFDLRFVRTK